MSERQTTLAAQAEAEQHRPGRAAHLAKIANAVRPIEYAVDAPSRRANAPQGIIRNANAPHHDVGRGS